MIPKYKRILYATDLSTNAREAFRHAIAFAQTYKAEVYFIHVIPEWGSVEETYHKIAAAENFVEACDSRSARGGREIQKRLEVFAKEEFGGHAKEMHVVNIEVPCGQPVDEILAASERHDVDLIVFGSHGKGRLSYTFLGTVVEKVLRKTRRPALVVPLPN